MYVPVYDTKPELHATDLPLFVELMMVIYDTVRYAIRSLLCRASVTALRATEVDYGPATGTTSNCCCCCGRWVAVTSYISLMLLQRNRRANTNRDRLPRNGGTDNKRTVQNSTLKVS